MKSESNPSESIVRVFYHHSSHMILVERCSLYHSLDWLAHIPSLANPNVLIGDEGYIGAQVI